MLSCYDVWASKAFSSSVRVGERRIFRWRSPDEQGTHGLRRAVQRRKGDLLLGGAARMEEKGQELGAGAAGRGAPTASSSKKWLTCSSKSGVDHAVGHGGHQQPINGSASQIVLRYGAS